MSHGFDEEYESERPLRIHNTDEESLAVEREHELEREHFREQEERKASIMEPFNKFIAILDKGINCQFCKHKLSSKDVDMYEHEGGIMTPYHSLKQWVYVTCPKCEYQWSHVKILKRGAALQK
jgi:hypothetical protein